MDQYLYYELCRLRSVDEFMSTIEPPFPSPIIRPHHGSPTAAIIACADDLEADLS